MVVWYTRMPSKCIPGGNVRRWYTRKYGSLTSDVFVLHKCDNPDCRNIDHIFLGSGSDNIIDALNKGRFIGHTGSPHSDESKLKMAISIGKLTVENVKEIRNSTEDNWILAKKFNVSWRAIYKVRKNLTWRYV